jgi:predicted dehydrogenase
VTVRQDGETRVSPVRIGIVGFGQIGRTHYQALQRIDGAEVLAVASRGGPPRDLDLDWTADYGDLLRRDDLDLIAICTPSGEHARQAIAALEAGKAVVVEKPMALNREDGLRVVETARRTGQFLSIISQRRTEPACLYLKEAIDKGALGRLVLGEALVRWHRDQRYYDSAPWRGTRAMDGGVLMNQAIHAIDLLLWYFGPVAEVTGATATVVRRMESEDTAVATLRFANGALGTISATTGTSPGLPAELNLFGDRGLISLHDADVVRWEVPEMVPPPPAENPGSGSSNPAAIGSLGHERQWREIVDAFRSGRDPLVRGEDALATVETIVAIEEASRTGRSVRIGSPV